MFKRLLIIPLIALIVFVTPLSVFASDLPSNVTNSVYKFELEMSNGAKFVCPERYNFGVASQTAYCILTNGIDSINTMTSITYDFTLTQDYDVYIMAPRNITGMDFANAFPMLIDYSSWNENFDYTLTSMVTLMNIESTDSTYSIDDSRSYENTIDVTFYKFNNVPATVVPYTIILPSFLTWLNASTTLVPFGVFVTRLGDNTTPIPPGGGTEGTLFDPWYDPDASFSDNVESINDKFREAVSSAETPDEQLFFTAYAQYQLDLIKDQSDDKFLGTMDHFTYQLDDAMRLFEMGLNFQDCLTRMSGAYVDGLRMCESPDQGTYMTTVYQARQQEMYHLAQVRAGQRLDNAISDAEMNEAADYYAAEEDLISQFSIQQLKDTVNYNMFFNLLMDRSTEVGTYRTILDFFLNEAAWRYWITIPMTFIIVSIVLGTGLKVATSSKGKKSSGGGKGSGK